MKLSQCDKEFFVRRPGWREGLYLVNVNGRWVYNEHGKPSFEIQQQDDFIQVHPSHKLIAAYARDASTRFYYPDGKPAALDSVLNNPGVEFALTQPQVHVAVDYDTLRALEGMGVEVQSGKLKLVSC